MKAKQKSKLKINFPPAYPAQLEVLKSCLQSDDKYIIVNGSRQVGKTFLLSMISIYWALAEKRQTIMIVSPTDSMVRKIYKDCITLLEPVLHIIVKNKKAQSGDSEIVFENGSIILFRSAASENSLRGYSLTHLALDECAFIKEETWNTILAPTLTVRGKKVLFCSTPKGSNFFQKLFNRGLSNEPGYRSFKINWRDNPYANIEFIQEQEKILPHEIYLQEYEGQFTDSSSVFKNIRELLAPKATQQVECVIGIDIAFKKDYTVAVALATDGRMLDYIRFNQVETQEMVEKLHAFILKWKPKKTVIEENNQGISIYHLLRAKGLYNFEAFNTNSKSKGEIINQLIAGFSLKEIKIINDPIVIGEFEAFTYSLTKSGNIQFSAAYGHDDIVMSTAIAWNAKKQNAVGQVLFM